MTHAEVCPSQLNYVIKNTHTSFIKDLNNIVSFLVQEKKEKEKERIVNILQDLSYLFVKFTHVSAWKA